MFKQRKKAAELERRKYLRLNSVFPVEFQILDTTATVALSVWMQGFTSNVSLGGLCLLINNIDEKTVSLLTQKDLQLSLHINIPLARPATKATGSVAWLSRVKAAAPNQYQLGIKYLMIDRPGLNRIMRAANWLKHATRLAISFAVIFMLAFSAAFFYNLKLRLENKKLVENLVSRAQEFDLAKDELAGLKSTKEELKRDLLIQKVNISQLQLKMQESLDKLQKGKEENTLLKSESQAYLKEIENLKKLISAAELKESSSQDKLSKIEEREKIISQDLTYLNKQKSVVEQEVIQKMLRWVSVHQNNQTGLILSYEGDNSLKDWAFIYDQALACQVFLLFSDIERAKKILNFFNRASIAKFEGFYNAYYSSSGDVAEYTIHAGPNIWLGIAILQYTHKTKDLSYLPLAEKIAAWLISLQGQDREGGLRGGPRVTWFSTEHNLDGYAFFNMLYEITHDKKYELARKKILNWLVSHAYSGSTPPIKRGKGDSTVATDTYAWSVAALGPETLKSIGMDPEKIMQFAEDNCSVTVNFKRPNKAAVEVKGFDFAKYANMPRGGVVSSEWSAQMVISYLVLSDFFARENNIYKQELFKEKAFAYLNELNKLIISSPSPTGQGEGCLPYATSEDADTGHGWRTPQGSSTGSVAGTCYTIFAQKSYNPLRIDFKLSH